MLRSLSLLRKLRKKWRAVLLRARRLRKLKTRPFPLFSQQCEADSTPFSLNNTVLHPFFLNNAKHPQLFFLTRAALNPV